MNTDELNVIYNDLKRDLIREGYNNECIYKLAKIKHNLCINYWWPQNILSHAIVRSENLFLVDEINTINELIISINSKCDPINILIATEILYNKLFPDGEV